MYSRSLSDHIGHLRLVLETLAKQQLYANKSKCIFAYKEMEYLGHLISGDGVKINPRKIAALQ